MKTKDNGSEALETSERILKEERCTITINDKRVGMGDLLNA